MTKDDFTVTLVPETLEKTYLTINNEGIRELNVVAVDPVDKTVTVKYGGAYSGTYDVIIKSKLNGNLDTEGI
jgi:riboflavin synthase alpha subunit